MAIRIPIGVVILVLLAGCQRNDDARLDPEEIACSNNLRSAQAAMDVALGDSPEYPKLLNELSEVQIKPSFLVCPATGHLAQSFDNVQNWTDYIYVGNLPDVMNEMGDIAFLICPPENHKGRHGIVVYLDGHVRILRPDAARKVIAEPWIGATNIPKNELPFLKSRVVLQIPKRLEKYYGHETNLVGPR